MYPIKCLDFFIHFHLTLFLNCFHLFLNLLQSLSHFLLAYPSLHWLGLYTYLWLLGRGGVGLGAGLGLGG